MNSLGTLSAYSAYAGLASYGSDQVSSVKGKQESSDAEISLPKIPSSGEINDEAIISDKAKALFENDKNSILAKEAAKEEPKLQGVKEPIGTEKPQEPQSKSPQPKEKLSPAQEQEVAQLKAIDAEVKAHEQAHMAAAAGINASPPTYQYTTGPDGKKYAVAGEVSLSFSTGGDPEEDIANAETMEAAALAPAQPSSQDMAVAQSAEKIIAEARQRLAAQKAQEADASNKSNEKGSVGETPNVASIKTDNQSAGELSAKTNEPPIK